MIRTYQYMTCDETESYSLQDGNRRDWYFGIHKYTFISIHQYVHIIHMKKCLESFVRSCYDCIRMWRNGYVYVNTYLIGCICMYVGCICMWVGMSCPDSSVILSQTASRLWTQKWNIYHTHLSYILMHSYVSYHIHLCIHMNLNKSIPLTCKCIQFSWLHAQLNESCHFGTPQMAGGSQNWMSNSIYMYVYVYVYIYIHVRVSVCVCVYVFVCVCVCI